jgi:hypothetical protein
MIHVHDDAKNESVFECLSNGKLKKIGLAFVEYVARADDELGRVITYWCGY